MKLVIVKYIFLYFFSLFSISSYAKENIELIVASSPGGSVHRYALHIQPVLEKILDKKVLLVFKPGAHGLVAVRELNSSPKEKLTLLIGNLNLPEVWKENLPNQKIVNLEKDIFPVVFLGTIPSIIFSRSDSEFSTFKQAIENSDNQKMTIAGAANTPNIKLIETILERNNKKNITIVPFKTGSQSLVGVIGNHVTMGITVPDILITQIEAGNVKPLAIIYENRLKSISNVPTLRELGLNFEGQEKYYNNMFLWTNVDLKNNEVVKIRSDLSRYLRSENSHEFISSTYVQFGNNSPDSPEKYLNKLLK